MTEIEAESGYLARARAALLDMYTDVISTETPEFVSGTDEVWFNQMYRLARARRAAGPGRPAGRAAVLRAARLRARR